MAAQKVIVIGAGPAGYAAGLYTGRADLKPLVLAGPEPGGQLMFTTEVENYPGFSNGVRGPELMEAMRFQAQRFGAEIKYESVQRVDFSQRPFQIFTEVATYEAQAVILTSGAKSRMLNIGEEKYLGRGVSTCAVCDAAFYKEKDVFVVGGGDAAIEDAWALTKFAQSVTMIVRRDAFRASKVMQNRVFDNPDKIKVIWNAEIIEVKGEGKLEQVVVKSEGEKQTLKADGLFMAIGHVPATVYLKESDIQLDEQGYVVTGLGLSRHGLKLAETRLNTVGLVEYPTMTNVEGVFAAGDAVDFRYRQAATAAGMGVAAALDAERWLESQS